MTPLLLTGTRLLPMGFNEWAAYLGLSAREYAELMVGRGEPVRPKQTMTADDWRSYLGCDPFVEVV